MWQQKGFTFVEIIAGLFILFLISIVSWHFFNAMQVKNSNLYFSNLAQTTTNYYKDQALSLEFNATASDLQKTCYQTEQTDFNNGHLTCGISVDRTIQVSDNSSLKTNIFNKLSAITEKESFVFNHQESQSDAYQQRFMAEVSNETRNCTVLAQYFPTSKSTKTNPTIGYSLKCSKKVTHIPPGYRYIPLR